VSFVHCSAEEREAYKTVRTTQGKGVMPDGTSRFKCKGKDILHFVSCLLDMGERMLMTRWELLLSRNTPLCPNSLS
jgi:Zn-dependent alcohol dehydrogenase